MDSIAAIGWEVIDRIQIGDFRGPSPHGIGIAVGYLAGSWWLLREGKARGLREDDISTVLLRALIGAILGARFFYVLAHVTEFGPLGELQTYLEMLKIWEGGISLIGGIFGAIILAYPYMRSARMGFLRTMDSAAIGLAFGIVFGRVGDLIIGDHMGKPTSWLLAFRYEGGPLSGYDCTTVADVCRQVLSNGQYQIVSPTGVQLHDTSGELLQQGIGLHQTALYDFISTFFLFAFLVWLSRRPRHQGFLIAVFGVWYGAMRVVTDFLRVDKRFFGLTGSQWASVAVGAIALFALAKWSRAGRVEAPLETVPAGGPAPAAEAATGVAVAEREPPGEVPTVIPSEPSGPGEEPAPGVEPQREVEPVPEPEPAPAPGSAPSEPASPGPEPEPTRDRVTAFTPPPDPTAR